nr:hypothetical protein [Tanacetum cinerariifolium]
PVFHTYIHIHSVCGFVHVAALEVDVLYQSVVPSVRTKRKLRYDSVDVLEVGSSFKKQSIREASKVGLQRESNLPSICNDVLAMEYMCMNPGRGGRNENTHINGIRMEPLPNLVKLPFCVSLTNPQPTTTRGSIYMLLTNGDILRVNAYSSTWEILTPPAPTLECDQAGTLKQLVKYSVKLGFAFKPPNGCWEIWVLNIDHSWEKAYVFTANQDIENKPIKVGLYDVDTRVVADRGTIISYMFKGGETGHSSQIFSFKSDF